MHRYTHLIGIGNRLHALKYACFTFPTYRIYNHWTLDKTNKKHTIDSRETVALTPPLQIELLNTSNSANTGLIGNFSGTFYPC